MSNEKNLQNIIDLMRRDDSVDAPPEAVQWAKNLYRTRATQPKTSFVKRLVAVLQMEVAPNRAAIGERSASPTTVRQMLYRAGDNAVDLRIESEKKRFNIRGQVLGGSFAGVAMRLFEDDRVFETTANDNSEFRFDKIPAGTYDLSIQGSELEITLKSIDIT